MIVRDFEIPDFFLIKLRKEQAHLYDVIGDQMDYARYIKSGYQVKTVIIDDEIVFIGGAMPMHSYMADGFFLLSESFPKHFRKNPKFFVKGIKRWIRNCPYKRIQTTVQKDFTEAEKFVKILGLEKEGLLRKVLPNGEDAYLYSIVRD